MSQPLEQDFVAQLRGMAGSTPVIAVPSTETIVRSGRSRVARRRSLYTGALGLALFAGAGIATMPNFGAPAPIVQATPVVAAQHDIANPLDTRVLAPEGIVATDQVSPLIETTEAVQPAETVQPTEATVGDSVVEAGGRTQTNRLAPLATGLAVAGTASLATAAGLIVRSRQLAPVPVRVRARQ